MRAPASVLSRIVRHHLLNRIPQIFIRSPALILHCAAMALALALGGCGNAGTFADTITTARDSAGVAIVENRPAASEAVCALSAEPRLDIGVAEGSPEYQLYRVFDAATLSDGRIAVVNQGSDEVRFYDAQGRYLGAFGREGGGPGEFRRVFQLWVLAGDTLVVGDYRPWRFSVFTADGRFIRAVEPRPLYVNPPDFMDVLADGSSILASECCRSDAPGFHERMLHVVRHSPGGDVVDTLGIYSRGRWGRLGPPELNFVAYPLFEASSRVAAAGDRVVVGRGVERELEILDPDGRLRGLVRWTGEDLAVSQEDVEAYRRETLARAETPDARRFAAPLVDESRPVNDRFPAHTTILLTRTGEIWVKEYTRPSRPGPDHWLVFDAGGRFICHARTPADLDVYEIGSDYVLGKEADTLDIEHVRIYGLTRSGLTPPARRAAR